MPGGNKIPARDDAESIPPALGVETCSEGRTTSAPAALPLGSGRNFHDSPACESLIASKRGNPFLHDLANETRSIFGRHLVVPFFNPFFHEPLNSEGCQYDLPR